MKNSLRILDLEGKRGRWVDKGTQRTLVRVLLIALTLMFTAMGEAASETEVISEDSDLIEIEYGGRMISVDIGDLLLMADENGGQKIDLGYPEKYTDQLESAPLYGIGQINPREDAVYPTSTYQETQRTEITEREYEEERRARRWTEIAEDLKLREIDDKALALVKEFGEAKDAVSPVTGVAGSVVLRYSSYTPVLVCRPMYVTDVILQPGEIVTGVHPGDSVRWAFVPSKSGSGDSEQIHVLIKPLAADISTNLIINTDRRTYTLNLKSSAANFMPSVSFSYPDDYLKTWDAFLAEKRKTDSSVISSGYSVNPEDLHLEYEIRGKDSLRWKPVRVWDDGVKTYIQFKKGSVRKSVEAPILLAYEHKKEVIVNYRVADDMYIADRVFDKAALIIGAGADQDRVVITRKSGK